ncbi:TPA: DNA utilization protein HofM [Escherichia coli]|nr:DNA utilization protein HofM [Escherichia coli]HAH9342470.1 DNA utilization protein HofM [Escherichia coli]
MAFKIWQIGLHLQQQEAVAVAIVRGAKECFLQRWWRLPLENDIIKDGRIVDAQQLAKTLLPWSRELPQRHHIMLAFPASRTLQRSFPRPSMSLGEREQTAWLSGTMARELDMDPDSLRFDYSEDSLSPAYNVTAAQSKELATLLTLAERLRVHVSAITPDASALQRFLPFLPSHQQCLAWRDNEQWLWATRYSWGRKLAVGMTSAKELAALLPEHAWLTTISWQQGTLEIKGLTTSITALNALETSLRQDASFHLNQRGATQQDAQGRWQFEYQLTRKVSDEHVL